MKKPAPTHVLLAGTCAELSELGELAAGLRRFGHSVAIARSTEEALGQPTPRVLVVTEAAGSNLFQAFNLPTGRPRGIFLSKSHDFQAAATATRHGADEVLGTPSLDALAEAVERRSAPVSSPSRHELEVHLGANEAHRGVLELLAFTTRLGVERGLRLRIGSATSELLALAGGPRTLRAHLCGDPLGSDRLQVEVDDLSGHLDKADGDDFELARSLSERLDVASGEQATTARLEFVLCPTHFAEDPAGLDDLDYFDPACLRELRDVLQDAGEHNGRDLFKLAPAAAATLMRLAAAHSQPLTALFASSAESPIQS